MTDDDLRYKLLISTLAKDEEHATWEIVPLYQVAAYLSDIEGWGDQFEIVGMYDLTATGFAVECRWTTGPASGREDINPTDRLLSVWLGRDRETSKVIECCYSIATD